MNDAHEQAALDCLNRVFGYTTFRSNQLDIVKSVLSGNDALVLMPTGGGKSVCYQIPALLLDGCAIIVSPLIALMQDQVDSLKQLGVKASFLNSSLSPDEVVAIEADLRNGDIDLLYIAPERLTQHRTINLLQGTKVALFAIDEAHCVSQWGHDFREDYLKLDIVKNSFPNVPTIALTATADKRTREEIVERLSLGAAKQYVSSFDRTNICYRIHLKDNPRKQLLSFIQSSHQTHAGIVYCLSRKKVEETAAWLRSQGYRALPYHAGLAPKQRAENQSEFLRSEGVIIVATIAFGMGIDKPDVRFVAHLDMPKTIESYYQETGRAGRDGEAADAWMVYGLQDVIKLRQMLQSSSADEQFRRAEQHRLNAMLGLCEVTTCRRQVLLKYFDEILELPCGNCDTCLDPVETWNGTEAAQKALSAVYRTGQRFGVNHLIDILRGQETAKVKQFGHERLPTFAVGEELDATAWRSVFRQLVARAYLTVDIDAFGALKLAEQARGVLRGEVAVALRKDPRSTSKVKAARKAALPVDVDEELFEALRARRTALAKKQGVPPYVIFHDKTLQEIAATMPQDLHQFRQISGVGESKLEKYGEEFLQVVLNAPG
ncbi:MAG: DNA helicase RecQ [Gammaproteobacteria bacterium]